MLALKKKFHHGHFLIGNIMKAPLTLLFYLSILYLGGCSHLEPKQDYTPIHWQAKQESCNQKTLANETCPTISFTGIQFNKPKQLNTIIDQQLLQMLNAPEDSTLQAYFKDSLARANNGYQLDISIKLLSENDVLDILQLSTKEMNTLDQYTPTKISFINYDKQKQKIISLNEAIKPDKIATFWSTAELAYKEWLELEQLLNNKIYQQDWPFVHTQNFALLPKFIVLKYDANTLAPYAMGEPKLLINYNQIKDIIKPEYLPR